MYFIIFSLLVENYGLYKHTEQIKYTKQNDYDMNIIRMHRMEFNASHGCYAEELTMKQKFIVNIDIYTDFSTAATEDRLDKTINYVDVYKLCEEIMLGDSVALIEHLSYKIGKALKQSFNTILKLKIEIQKRDVQLGGKLDYVSVIWEA